MDEWHYSVDKKKNLFYEIWLLFSLHLVSCQLLLEGYPYVADFWSDTNGYSQYIFRQRQLHATFFFILIKLLFFWMHCNWVDLEYCCFFIFGPSMSYYQHYITCLIPNVSFHMHAIVKQEKHFPGIFWFKCYVKN
jgi:hypothetical protein